MNLRNIYSLVCVALILLSCSACKGPAQSAPEEAPGAVTGPTDPRNVDPLELPSDREVVPQIQPRGGAISGRDMLIPSDTTTIDTTTGISGPVVVTDTLNSQVYRVQLHTGKLFGDARREVQIAEEIFDLPVYMDYEVPYFKVRVGSFADRSEAEAYQLRAKAAGYANAWVVLVTVNKQEAGGLYDNVPIPVGSDSTVIVPEPGIGPEEE